MKRQIHKAIPLAALLFLAAMSSVRAQTYIPKYTTPPTTTSSQIYDNGITYGQGIGINTTHNWSSNYISTLVPSSSSVAENCFQIAVSDAFTNTSGAGDYFRVYNGTVEDGIFSPTVIGHVEDANTDSKYKPALGLVASCGSGQDVLGSTLNALMIFDSRLTAGPVGVRPLFTWASYGNYKMVMDHNGNLALGNYASNGTLGIASLEVNQSTSTQYACFLSNVAGGGKGLRIKGGFYNDTVPLLQVEANNSSGGPYAYGNERMVVLANGCVGIGTNMRTNPNNYLLAVNGTIGVKGSVVVENTSLTWPDYVFEKEYKPMSLADLETYVAKEKHLPGVQSQDEIQKHGQDLGKDEAAILKNVEELSLHLIELQKENEALKARIAALENKKP